MVNGIIEKAMASTDGPRQEQNMPMNFTKADVDEIVTDEFGGWNKRAVEAFYEFRNAIVCTVVVDERYKLYMDFQQAEADAKGIYVWDMPDDDLMAIFDWALSQENLAEQQIKPFRDGSTVGKVLRSSSPTALQTERPDRV